MSKGNNNTLLIGNKETAIGKMLQDLVLASGYKGNSYVLEGESISTINMSTISDSIVRMDFKALALSGYSDKFLQDFNRIIVFPCGEFSIAASAQGILNGSLGLNLSESQIDEIVCNNSNKDYYVSKFGNCATCHYYRNTIIEPSPEVEPSRKFTSSKPLINIIEVMKLPVGTIVEITDSEGRVIKKDIRIGLGKKGKVFLLPNGYEADLDSSTIASFFYVTTRPVSFSDVVKSKCECTVYHELIKEIIAYKYY